jgi:cell division protease FtsH
MNKTVKVILMWVLILVAAVGLYNLVEHGGSPATSTLNFTEFLNKVDRGEVASVVVSETNLTGTLKNNEIFRSTIPDDYTAVYDKLTSRNVRVTIIPPERNPWYGATALGLPAWVILVGSILWLAISLVILVLVVDLSRFVKRELARTSGNHSTT